jgi:membrane-bound lytic murein transglycosylase
MLLALLMGCASTPPGSAADATAQPPAPAASTAAPEASSVPSPPAAAAGAASGNSAQDVTRTPEERLARAKQAASQANVAAAQALQQQCSEIRSEIRAQQIGEQQAPSTSVSEQIVQAKEAHSDQRIQKLQDQYDALDCAATQAAPTHEPLMPAPAAPNGLGAPGAQGTAAP